VLSTIAVYLFIIDILTPVIIILVVYPLAANLFIFYCGIISAITPPVALASIVAAGIAEEKPLATSLTSLKLGLPGFLLPFMFVLGPELVLEGTTSGIILSVITAIIGIFVLSKIGRAHV